MSERARTTLIAFGFSQRETEVLLEQARDELLTRKVVDDILSHRNRAQEVATQRGITLKQAYRRIHNERLAGELPAGSSLRDYILEALLRLNARVGVAGPTLLAAVNQLRPPHQVAMDELIAQVWACQKQGWVKFDEAHGSAGSVLSKIRLTPSGRGEANKLHPAKKPGRKSQVEVVTKGRAPEIAPSIPYVPPVKQKLGDPLRQNEKPNNDEPYKWEVQEAGANALQDPRLAGSYVRTRWPEIDALLIRNIEKGDAEKRAQRFLDAAAMIESLDEEEAAVLMDRAQEVMSPYRFSLLESQVLELLKELGVADRKEMR